MKTPKYTRMDSIQTVAKTMMNYDNDRTVGFKAEYIPPTKDVPQHWKLSRQVMSNFPLGSLEWQVI